MNFPDIIKEQLDEEILACVTTTDRHQYVECEILWTEHRNDDGELKLIGVTVIVVENCDFAVDPMPMAKLLQTSTISLFDMLDKKFLRVVGLYEGVVMMVDFLIR